MVFPAITYSASGVYMQVCLMCARLWEFVSLNGFLLFLNLIFNGFSMFEGISHFSFQGVAGE